MSQASLLAISPIDGRYSSRTTSLQNYFSEYALIKYRVIVEIRYFIALSEFGIFKLSTKNKKQLEAVISNFNIADAEEIKATERITNHDVKAVEYFVKKKLDQLGLSADKEWVHFGLTSQDINNTAVPMMWRDAMDQEYIPMVQSSISMIKASAQKWKNIPMLARTHGQPATPTTLGKEMQVFVERLETQLKPLLKARHSGKFGGATGNFNAHIVAFPKKNWKAFAKNFLQDDLGLQRQTTTTQIEHYDGLAEMLDNMKRIHTILIDLCRDIWQYVSMEFFKQKIVKNEVGSSAMPHKVNPIDFENAEGNLLIANANLEFLAAKLPISRLQRDLTDSTVLRNIGVPVAHASIALQSLMKGWGKLELNKQHIENELDNQWIILAEAIQTILRREQYEGAYEALKSLTRGKSTVSQKDLHEFIDNLPIKSNVKKEMKSLTPHNYIGNAANF